MPDKKWLFACCALLLLPLSTEAAKWVRIGSRNKAQIEIDKDSVQELSAGQLRIWVRESYAQRQLVDSGAFSYSRATTLAELNCKTSQGRLLQRRFIAADGTELKVDISESKEEPVAPDSAQELALTYACKQLLKPSEKTAEKSDADTTDAAKKPPPKKNKAHQKPFEDPLPPLPPPEWAYSGDARPEKWGSLSTDYALCGIGEQQAPIDIRQTILADLPSLAFAYKASPFSIIDNGHTLRVDLTDGGEVGIGDERFSLKQIYFHRPSEEKIKGKNYPMSAHLIHQSASGKHMIIAVLMNKGKEHALIRTIWTNIPLTQGKPFSPANTTLDLTQLVPSKRDYYTFMGSLTMPPCSEGVLWVVLKSPIQVSAAQLDGFAMLYKNNARPVQALNGRAVKESQEPPKPAKQVKSTTPTKQSAKPGQSDKTTEKPKPTQPHK